MNWNDAAELGFLAGTVGTFVHGGFGWIGLEPRFNCRMASAYFLLLFCNALWLIHH